MNKIHRNAAAVLAASILTLGLSACGSDTSTTATADKPEAPISSTTPDPDQDADGVVDSEDAFPHNANEWADDNGNGVGDNRDAAKAVAAAKARAKARAAVKAQAAVEAKVNGASAPSERQWAQIVKNPDVHKGEVYRIYAQIWQFDSATGDNEFLATTANHNTMSYGYFDGDNAMFKGGPRQLAPYVEDDVIVATVSVDGSYSYDTQAGGNTTVPMLTVYRIARG